MVGNNTLDILKDPFLIGFSRELDRISSAKFNSSTSYPPYNVLKYSDDKYSIELAVAGFEKHEIEVELEDGTLTVKGDRLQVEVDEYFVHRGIASRKFTRTFALGEFMEVEEAELKNGILTIPIVRVVPEDKKPKQITIK